MADELPDQLEERMRAFGATDTEIDRFRNEHNDMDYYDRFVANQRGAGFDDASVQALLELSRERWKRIDAGEEGVPAGGSAIAAGTDQPATESAETDRPPTDDEPVPEEAGGVTVPPAGAAAQTAQDQPGTRAGQDDEQVSPGTPGGTGTAPETTPGSDTEDGTSRVDPALVDKVPSGTRDKVLDWVQAGRSHSEQQARARAALQVERQSSDPRTSLITRLEGIVG